MANVYVDDTATGANSGLNKTDAYTSLTSADGGASGAGDKIVVAHTHNETDGTGSITLAFSGGTLANPIKIISTDFADDSFRPGAIYNLNGSAADLRITGNIFVSGVTLTTTDPADDVNFGVTNNVQKYEDCVITSRDGIGIAAPEGIIEFVNCAVTSTSFLVSFAISVSNEASFKATNTSFVHSVAPTLFGVGDNSHILLEACDLSVDTDEVVGGFDQGQIDVVIRRCKMLASFSAIFGSIIHPLTRVLLEGCTDGTITVPELGLTELSTFYGTVKSTLAVYRTGGANDGENVNAYSWEMATNANALEQFGALETPPMPRWVDPDTTPSGATTQGIFTSTRMAIQGTPVALTTDASSTWNGSGVGTKQKITVTLNNQNGATLIVYVASGATLNDDDFWIEVQEPDQVGGPITVRCFLAKPSITVYVDPKLEVA